MSIKPFSEGSNQLDRISITYLSNSIDTSGIDPFRQGVELTQDKHFQMGIAKIWSGNTGHVLELNDIGERDDEIFPDDTSFHEVVKFVPSTFVKTNMTDQVIVIDSHVSTNEVGFDGVIEPLSIRRVVAFTSIDAPFEAHSVKANVESGNYDPWRSSSLIVSRYVFSEVSVGSMAYEDNVDMTGRVPSGLGFWPSVTTTILGFDDSRTKDGVIVPSDADTTMAVRLEGMSPPTDNYIPSGYVSTAASLYDYRDYGASS